MYFISLYFRDDNLDIIQHNQIDMKLGLVAAAEVAAVVVVDMIEMIIDKITKTIVVMDMTIAIQPISIQWEVELELEVEVQVVTAEVAMEIVTIHMIMTVILFRVKLAINNYFLRLFFTLDKNISEFRANIFVWFY